MCNCPAAYRLDLICPIFTGLLVMQNLPAEAVTFTKTL